MSDLIAVGYPNTMSAEEALEQLVGLQAQKLIKLDDAVIVERRSDGKVKLHQPGGSTTSRGAMGGAMWGGLIGLLFFAPLLGMALGASSGALVGSKTDAGIDDSFMRDLGGQLQPGGAALVMLIREAITDKIMEQMYGQHGGRILQTSLSKDDEAALKMALDKARARKR